MKSGIKSIILIGVLGTVLALGACSSSRAAVAPFTGSVPPPTSSFFKVNNLAVNPPEVNPGVQILMAAYVTNTGVTSDKYSGRIRIDNVSKPSLPTYIVSPEVSVPAGANQLLSVTTTITNPGTYKVTWGDASEELVVNPNEAQTSNGNENTSSNLVNIAAPDFNAVDVVTGKAVSLKQFAGKAILLNFVNYGCNPDLNNIVSAQLLVIKQLQQQRSDFVPVSVFCGCCPPDVLRQFAKENNLDWPWILDTDYSIAEKYGNYLKQYGYPTLVFIDTGMVIREYTGAVDISVLNKKIDNLVSN